MDSLDEMQYGAVRDELRMRIAAFYGVSNIFMMDSGKGGGLNNEGMQILVTNRAVEFGQKLYGREVFPRLFKAMGVTDWEMTLYPNEEEDDVTRLRRDEMEVNIAQRMQQLGFQPELTEDAGRDIRFFYKKPEMGQQMMPPQQGGMPPGPMPPEDQGPPGGAAPGMAPPPPGMMAPGMAPPGVGMPRGPMGQPAMPTAAPPQGGAPTDPRATRQQRVGQVPSRVRPRGNQILTMEKGMGAGSGSEGEGERQGVSPVSSETARDGAPKSKKNQRGHKKGPMEQALDAIEDAKASAADPLNNKKESNLN